MRVLSVKYTIQNIDPGFDELLAEALETVAMVHGFSHELN